MKPSSVILNQCLKVKKGEKVLIVTDTNKLNIAKEIFNQSKKITDTTLINIPVGKVHGEEPPKYIADLMQNYNVIIAPTTKSLTHTKAVKNASKNARIATLPGITEKIFKETLTADYNKIKNLTEKIYKKIKNKNLIKVTTPSGSNFSLKPRKWILDTGIIHNKGKIGNLPAGEVFTAPLNTNGTLIVDIGKANETYLKNKTKIIIKNNKVVNISDKKSKLAQYFKEIKNATNIAEFGIGTNYKAKVIGIILEDEKAIGTCHIAFGNSSAIGGKIYSKLHLDTILLKPTISVNNKIIMKNGNLLI